MSKRVLLGFFAVVILMVCCSGQVVEFSGCQELSVSGATYVLNSSIVDSVLPVCLTITGDDVVLDCQGHTVDGNVSLNGDASENQYGIRVDASNVTVKNCIVSRWQTGLYLNTGADHAKIFNNTVQQLYGYRGLDASDAHNNPGGDAICVYVLSDHNNISNNTMKDSEAGRGGSSSTNLREGGLGGISAGVYLDSCINTTVSFNVMENLDGGRGGGGSGLYCTGGSGGTSSGVYLSESSDLNITSNRIYSLMGGMGGTGTFLAAGGVGGLASSVYFSDSSNVDVSLNNVSSLVGGQGGTGGSRSCGGSGGVSAVAYLYRSTTNILTSNTADGLSGGVGGNPGFEANYGAPGTSAFVWIKDSLSYSNTLTPILGDVPDTSKLNYVDGSPVLYFYEKSELNLSFYQVNSSSIPILLGGSALSGKAYVDGGVGGVSAGIALIKVTDSTVSFCNISYSEAMSGSTSGLYYLGGRGGNSYGLYLSENVNTSVSYNTIYAISGGIGGGGSIGGLGGTASGICLSSSTDNIIFSNQVFSLAGGDGGDANRRCAGGAGGIGSAILLVSSQDNTIMSNNATSLSGGSGGSGGTSGGNGAPGTSVFVWVNETNSYRNNITVLSGNAPDLNSMNYVDGSPVLYFYGSSGLNVTGFHISSSSIPILIEGSENSDDAVDGGIASGIVFVAVDDSVISENAITYSGRMSGGTGTYGGVGGITSGIYLHLTSNTEVSLNNVSSLVGGYGGSGSSIYTSAGSGGVCTGICLSQNSNATVTSNRILSLTGGVGGRGGFYGRGGMGGIGTSVYDSSGLNTNISGNYGSTLKGGNGGTSGSQGNGGTGGTGSGVFVDSGSNGIVLENDFYSLIGGKGGSASLAGSGGYGGLASGIYVSGTSGSNVSLNTFSILSGGQGGTGDYIGQGGAGGIASGFVLSSSTGNFFSMNNISSLSAGAAGVRTGHYGAPGTCAFVWLKDEVSFANTLTPLTGGVPDAGSMNYVEDLPILHFYNESGVNISGYSMVSDEVPILIGGSTASPINQQVGAAGGISAGIVFVNIYNSTVSGNHISYSGSMSGGTGGPQKVGGAAGFSSGFYVSGCDGMVFSSNQVYGISGGQGGTGGYDTDGGPGGDVGSFYMVSSSQNNLSLNRVRDLSGGVGGTPGTYCSTYAAPGSDFALVFSLSWGNLVFDNLFNASGYLDFEGSVFSNVFNVSRYLGSRVFSVGNWVGGNYYTNPSGAGFSDVCGDVDHDGFCDVPLVLASSNVDYLALSDEFLFLCSVFAQDPCYGGFVDVASPDFGFTVNGTAQSYVCEVFVDGVGVGVDLSVDDRMYTVISSNSSFSEGVYNWEVNCTGNVSNSSGVLSFTVDLTSPEVCLVSPLNNSFVNTSSVGINWSLVENNTDSVVLYWNGTPVEVSGEGYVVSDLSDGTYSYFVWVNDSAAHVNQTGTWFLTVDLRAPIASFVSPTPGDGIERNIDSLVVNWSLSEENLDSMFLVWNGSFLPANDTFYNVSGLGEGTYSYYVWVNDSAGNVNVSESRTIVVDRTAPIVSVFSPGRGGVYLGSSVLLDTLMVDGSDNLSCWYSLDSWVTNVSFDCDSASVPVSLGSYTLRLAAVDEVGNLNNTESVSFEVISSPQSRKHLDVSVEAGVVGEEMVIHVADEDGYAVEDASFDVFLAGVRVESMSTDSEGLAYFIPLEAGDYIVYAEASGYYGAEEDFTVGEAVDFCSDGVRDYDEADIDCGGVDCSACGVGESCSLDSDCGSGWCLDGVCTVSTCTDGILGPGEEEVDCGGVCPSCGGVDVSVNGSAGGLGGGPGGGGYVVNNATSVCVNGRVDEGETDVDCGGVCLPCSVGRGCVEASDCVSGFCPDGVCRVSSCSDGFLGFGEEKLDCGGVCEAECPRLKLENKYLVDVECFIGVLNPLADLSLRIQSPSGKTEVFNVSRKDYSNYSEIWYVFKEEGRYVVELPGYETRSIWAEHKKTTLPLTESFPESIQSLLIFFLFLTALTVFASRIRYKTLMDESALRRLSSEDMLRGGVLSGLWKIYAVSGMSGDVSRLPGVVYLELNESELDEAEELRDRYGLGTDAARSLVLCRRIKARKLVTGAEFPEKLGGRFEGTLIVSLSDAFLRKGL